jgi:hypothetical protein
MLTVVRQGSPAARHARSGMKAVWLGHHLRRQVQVHRWVILAASAAFCLLALVAGGARLGARTVARWGAFVGQNVHLIVYLSDDVDQDRAQDLAELLRRVPTVAQVTAIEPATALTRLTASATAFGLDGKALDGLEPAYFPRSLEVSLAPAADLSERASDLAKRLRPVPGILQVDAMGSGLARLSVWVKLGRKLGAVVLAALALVSSRRPRRRCSCAAVAPWPAGRPCWCSLARQLLGSVCPRACGWPPPRRGRWHGRARACARLATLRQSA